MSWKFLNRYLKTSSFFVSLRLNLLCLVAGTFAFSIFVEAFAKDKNYLEIGKSETLDSVGLKFRQIKDSLPVPLPTLSTLKLKASNGEPIISYNSKDLLVHEEVILQWKNPAGTLVLAKMTLPSLDGLKIIFKEKENKYCLKEDFDAWKKNMAAIKDEKTIIAWLNVITGCEFKAPFVVTKGSSKLPAVRKFSIKKDNATIWALELTQPGTSDYAPIFFIFTLDSASDKAKNELALTQFISGLAFVAPVKNNIAQESKEPKDTFNYEKIEKELSPELIASRDAVIKSIADLKGWWHEVTDNFVILSNVQDKKAVHDLEPSLESCYSIFTEYYPVIDPLIAFSACRIFQSREGYDVYVGPGFDWSNGIWMSSRKELVIVSQTFEIPKDKRDFISSVFCHEGFHQYLYHVSGETLNSMWFDEGNAAYFEGIELKSRGKYAILACPKYLGDAIRLASKKELPVAELLSMNAKALSAGDSRQDNCAISWAIVYYLRNGCQLMGKRRDYENVLSRYYDGIRKLKTPDKATAFAFEGIDIKNFAGDLTAFFKESDAMIRKSEKVVPVKYLSSEPKKKSSWWENTPEEDPDKSKDDDDDKE